MGGGAGVLGGARVPAQALGHPGGEALVVELHGDLPAEPPGETLGEGAGLAVWAVSAPSRPERKPDQDSSASRSLASAASRARPRRVPGWVTGSIGVTIVPVGSLIAQPHRALP